MKERFCVYCMHPSEGEECSACGKTSAYQMAPHHLQPGTILGGKYKVGAVLGEGGFGITYIGLDVNLNMKVAIKEYYPSGVVNRNNTSSAEITASVGSGEAFFEKGKTRFLGEARTLAKFADEPNIVSVRDFFSENNTAYIVMEYLEGIDLKEFIARNGKVSFDQAVTMLEPIMKALSKIHAQGLIHRDISPANIMILNDGSVKLLDFGAAREVGGGDEKSLSILLKPGYAPEEQYRTKGKQGSWTDVYALSATMYKILTGITPDDAMNRVFSDDVRAISELNPDVSVAQQAVIMKGMAVQQKDRFQTIDELYKACVDGKVPGVPTAVQNITKTVPQPTLNGSENVPPVKTNKKPNLWCFIASILTGLLTLGGGLISTICIAEENDFVLPILFTVAMVAATFFLGRLYFSRLDNKNRKPNVICLIAGILATLNTVFWCFSAYVVFSDGGSEASLRAFSAAVAIESFAFPIFFGYFYYPRLEKKKKRISVTVYSSIVAVLVLCFVGGLVFTGLSTITIGDENISRDATRVYLSMDIINDSDLIKLKELKNLESLEIFECFLDDKDVEVIGELTQLKQLSLSTNTDITDVSPLNNLSGLTSLNIENTQVTDISCLNRLTNLETLNISNTKVKDLSVLETYTVLDTLYMDSLQELDATTISLPESLYTLHCNSCNLQNLEFVADSPSLTNIYAANNQIENLTPLSSLPLYIVDLSANNICDISLVPTDNLNTLDVSTNAIQDISCLKGVLLPQLDISYNQVQDISALTDNHKLFQLDINNNAISDISPLKDCFRIFSLNISYNQITDISALATIDDLEHFEARGNAIVDISALSQCEKLIESGNTVDLRDNQISDVTALGNYIHTEHIYLSGNAITSVVPLKNCAALEMLTLNNNQITDISALNSLQQLRILEIVNNPVSDLSNLALAAMGDGILEKATLRVSYHETIDFEALAQEENLTVIIYDAPERQKDRLGELGFWSFPSSEELDEVEENPDIEASEDETGGDMEEIDG